MFIYFVLYPLFYYNFSPKKKLYLSVCKLLFFYFMYTILYIFSYLFKYLQTIPMRKYVHIYKLFRYKPET